MNTTKTIAALFDFDGVIMDTETQYTVFWNEQGLKYLNEEDFGRRIKGQTLAQMALAWCFHNQRVNSVIVGTSSVKQLEENIQALENVHFTDEELWLIGEI